MKFVNQIIQCIICGAMGGLAYLIHPAIAISYIVMVLVMLGFHMEDLAMSLSGHNDDGSDKQ